MIDSEHQVLSDSDSRSPLLACTKTYLGFQYGTDYFSGLELKHCTRHLSLTVMLYFFAAVHSSAILLPIYPALDNSRATHLGTNPWFSACSEHIAVDRFLG